MTRYPQTNVICVFCLFLLPPLPPSKGYWRTGCYCLRTRVSTARFYHRSPGSCYTNPGNTKRLTGIILNSNYSPRPPFRAHRTPYTSTYLTLSTPPHPLIAQPPWPATSNISNFPPRRLALPSNGHFNLPSLMCLDAGSQILKTEDSIIHIVSNEVQKSNIVAASVCARLSRSDTIALLLNAVRGRDQSIFGIVLHILLQPFLRLLAGFTTSAMQSVLHVLFLLTPFKSNAHQGTDAPEEVLKAGALYRTGRLEAYILDRLCGRASRVR
ncbi:hypothetical protein BDR03DRAFT_966131 [Suillus americanus]|nr:hypothetical protein BDR03DRAFT_966131 [Suillus americanus]